VDDKELIGELDAIRVWFDADGMEKCSRLTALAAARLTALAEENERLKNRLGMVKRESERDARDAAIEARWQARNEANGEPYGTY
jgi:hypothetical protein